MSTGSPDLAMPLQNRHKQAASRKHRAKFAHKAADEQPSQVNTSNAIVLPDANHVEDEEEELGTSNASLNSIVRVFTCHVPSDEEQLAAAAAEQDSVSHFLEEQRSKGYTSRQFALQENEAAHNDVPEDIYKLAPGTHDRAAHAGRSSAVHQHPGTCVTPPVDERAAALEHVETMRKSANTP